MCVCICPYTYIYIYIYMHIRVHQLLARDVCPAEARTTRASAELRAAHRCAVRCSQVRVFTEKVCAYMFTNGVDNGGKW